MAVVSYTCVSLDDQNPALQLDALTAAGADRVYVDHATGSTMSRPQLRLALVQASADDVLTVWRLDRLGRSMTDLIAHVNELAMRGIEFRSLTETIDTTPGGRLVFHVVRGPSLSSSARSSSTGPRPASPRHRPEASPSADLRS
ncbi:recombinase family protein [Terracoccus luteus]|uniref:recombinase family protein n=1 Tax=Terracoccus luteus TaxID=53356 RepID=UPI001B8698E4